MSATEAVGYEVEGPLATVRLADAAGHNRLSDDLRTAMIGALREAAADPRVRVVVLEGLPEIFCAGGSVEQMLRPHERRIVPVWEFLRAVVDCPLPVVAAAQGHALGGGFLLALYCDVVVLSDRSRYAANFLAYGFTPVLGATHLLPAKLGAALGAEMLYTARSYRGRELADRGAGVTVTAHDKVCAEAQRTALRIAQAPRDALERLKAHLRAETLERAEAALAREIPDHEATIGSAEARRRIRTLHGERIGAARVRTDAAPVPSRVGGPR
ncbi:polyketide synthase [Streptomyces sp. ODS05-4]|uniref:polyketide synthase n=1 Tax=Streptomyces sp. ODS05-4 TaxID=2944939 RepID=UPI00210A26CA|nr:polyketide synthase [Streptomyces sp. ODS05-4]